MRKTACTTLVFACIAAAYGTPSFGQTATNPTTLTAPQVPSIPINVLTLAQAWQWAESSNASIKLKAAQLTAAEGLRTDANVLLFNNPQLSLEGTRRDVPQSGLPTERRSEWGVGLSQTLELGGQRGYRREAADAALAALRAEIDALRLQVRHEVAQQFYRVLALQQRIELEAQALTLFDGTAVAIQKRRVAGEDTKLDANVAAVEAERARNQLAVAQEQLLDARSDLATKLQLPAEQLPLVAGDLETQVKGTPYALERLLSNVEAQPKFAALASREDSARAKIKLEQASRTPDVTVGLSVAREGPTAARERVTMLSVSVPLPLFKRNASGIGQASSDLQQAQIERQTTLRDTQAEVRALWGKLTSLQSRVRRFQDSVLPTLGDNEQLSVKSKRAGQIGLLELIVIQRQSLDARRDLLDALTEYQITRIALERAAGWMQEGTKP